MKFSRSDILKIPQPTDSRSEIIARAPGVLDKTGLVYKPSGASGVDAPETIFAGQLKGHWRAGTWTLSGSQIDRIDDLSGNGAHMVQTGVNRPTTTTVGGVDAARFDPTTNAQWLQTSGTHSVSAAPHALWALYRTDGAVSAGMVIVPEASHELRQGTSQAVTFRVSAASINSTTTATVVRSVVGEDAAGTAVVYVNNVNEGSASATTNLGTLRTWALGARSGGTFANNMTLIEAAMISGAITSAQRAALQAYAESLGVLGL